MASLDVDSLFTNIQLEETTDISIDNFYKDVCIRSLTRFFVICLPWPPIMFKNKFYKQIDGVTMGSPLGLTAS